MDDACSSVETALAKAEPELAAAFGAAFGELAAARRLPNTLLLSAHQYFVPWLTAFFERIDFAQFTLTSRPFTVEPISAKGSRDIIWEPGVGTDQVIAEAVAFINTEISAHD